MGRRVLTDDGSCCGLVPKVVPEVVPKVVPEVVSKVVPEVPSSAAPTAVALQVIPKVATKNLEGN